MHNPNGYLLIYPDHNEFEDPTGNRWNVNNLNIVFPQWVVITYFNHSKMLRSAILKMTPLQLIKLEEQKEAAQLEQFFIDNPSCETERHCFHVDFGVIHFCHDCKYGECRAH